MEAGDHSDLEGLTPGTKLRVVGSDDGIVPDGRESGHIEDLPERGTAAGDAALADVFARIAVEGSDAHQSCDLLAVDAAQFGQLDKHGSTADRTNAGDLAEFVETGLMLGVLAEGLFHESIELEDLGLEGLDQGLDALAEVGLGGVFKVAQGDDAQVLDLLAAGEQGLVTDLGLGTLGAQTGFDVVAVACQNAGIEGVGLSQNAQGLGVITDRAGIGHGHVMAGLLEQIDQEAFISAGGLHDDAFDLETLEQGQKQCDALRVVLEAVGRPYGPSGQVEMGLGYIDADGAWDGGVRYFHRVGPFLVMRARSEQDRPKRLCGFNTKTESVLQLSHGVKAPRVARSPRPACPALSAEGVGRSFPGAHEGAGREDHTRNQAVGSGVWGRPVFARYARCDRPPPYPRTLPNSTYKGGRYSGRVRAWQTGDSRIKSCIFRSRIPKSFVLPRPHPA